MARWGTILILAAAVSAVLSFTSYELRLLFWIGLWGDGVAWLIRAGLAFAGVVLLQMDRGSRRVATTADSPQITR